MRVGERDRGGERERENERGEREWEREGDIKRLIALEREDELMRAGAREKRV